MEKINICIVHYNTPYLTECLVKSINKHVGYNCHIYIFDNSDKHPFVYKQDNITLFDNTKGQIINFDKWLEKYPNKILEAKRNGYGSAKHCYTVEKCFDLLNVDEFILMDSDILLKQDVRNIYNNENIFAAEILKQNNKIIEKAAPFLCYINVKKCKEVGVHYFNENYMFGLHKTDINPKCDLYDTGAWFYFDAKKYQHKTFKLDDYIVHYGNASWNHPNDKYKMSPEEWVKQNQKMWNEEYIISLTSFPKRISCVTKTLTSLLNQTSQVDKICLNLAIEEFPNKIFSLPEELQLFLKNNPLIEVHWLKHNTKVWKKIIPTLFRYKNANIISVDDDFIYPKDFIETIKLNHEKKPNNPLTFQEGKHYGDFYEHLGPGTMTKYSFIGESFNLLSNELFNDGVDDNFFTYCYLLNNNTPLYVGNKPYRRYFQRFAQDEGYSIENNIDNQSNWKKHLHLNKQSCDGNEIIKYICEEDSHEKVVVSFTTYKNRVKYAPEVIKSLLNQTIKPYKICLTLYKEDLQYITPELQYFFDNGDVELLISDVDIAPHTKYYYSMKKYKNYPIVTVDDDVIYDSTLIETLYNGYLRNNMCISAGRTHKIKYNIHGTPLPYNQWQYEYKENELEPSFDIFATGIGGVLYPPNILQIDDISIEDIMKCLYADDVFLKKRENDLKIKVQWTRGNKILMGKSINLPEVQNTGLALINNLKSRNDEYIKNIGLCKVNEINKQVIYTCLTGDYENLVDPSVVSEDFDYVCFSDNLNLSTNVWKLRPIPDELLHLSKIKQQRCIKICPHKYLSEYETSVWIDASIDILGNINQLLKQDCSDIDKSIFIPKHPSRNCVYEEIKACLHFKKDTLENMEPQINKYKSENYPSNNGMVQTGIMIRKHNELCCIEVMELWKDELVKHSHRDQLSFNYALWKTNNHKTLKYLDKSLFNSKYFKCYHLHNRKPNNTEKQNNTKNVDSLFKHLDNLVDILYNQ